MLKLNKYKLEIIKLKTILCNEWKLLVDVEKEKGKMKRSCSLNDQTLEKYYYLSKKQYSFLYYLSHFFSHGQSKGS